MDYRLPVAIVLGVVFAILLAWSELRDPECSEKYLNTFAFRAFVLGLLLISFAVLPYIGRMPILDVLAARVESVKIQGAIVFAYACLFSSLTLWIAASFTKK